MPARLDVCIMKPAPSETAEILHRVRQQLILAQVRIMESEDARDELLGRITDLEKLMADAQLLTDRKIEEASHLEKVRQGLQGEFEHMRHMQHVTNEALNLTRNQLASAEQDRNRLQQKIISLVDQASQLNSTISRLSGELTESNDTAAARLDQINRLDAELHGMKATRSWRWTAWMRLIGNAPSGRKS